MLILLVSAFAFFFVFEWATRGELSVVSRDARGVSRVAVSAAARPHAHDDSAPRVQAARDHLARRRLLDHREVSTRRVWHQTRRVQALLRGGHAGGSRVFDRADTVYGTRAT